MTVCHYYIYIMFALKANVIRNPLLKCYPFLFGIVGVTSCLNFLLLVE